MGEISFARVAEHIHTQTRRQLKATLESNILSPQKMLLPLPFCPSFFQLSFFYLCFPALSFLSFSPLLCVCRVPDPRFLGKEEGKRKSQCGKRACNGSQSAQLTLTDVCLFPHDLMLTPVAPVTRFPVCLSLSTNCLPLSHSFCSTM